MEFINSIISFVSGPLNDFAWMYTFLPCAILGGFYLTIRNGGIQFTKFGHAMKNTVGKIFHKQEAGEGAVTPFQAVTTALSATVGTGNIVGASGAGKTRSIFRKHAVQDICRITDYGGRNGVRFDAYHTQPVLVFEEFHSQIPIESMLNFLDIYPATLPARYQDKTACYTTVYITSNIPLEAQYPDIQRYDMETWKAFLRRIHTVTQYHEDGRKEILYDKRRKTESTA